jgi:hypothetical protein
VRLTASALALTRIPQLNGSHEQEQTFQSEDTPFGIANGKSQIPKYGICNLRSEIPSASEDSLFQVYSCSLLSAEAGFNDAEAVMKSTVTLLVSLVFLASVGCWMPPRIMMKQ